MYCVFVVGVVTYQVFNMLEKLHNRSHISTVHVVWQNPE